MPNYTFTEYLLFKLSEENIGTSGNGLDRIQKICMSVLDNFSSRKADEKYALNESNFEKGSNEKSSLEKLISKNKSVETKTVHNGTTITVYLFYKKQKRKQNQFRWRKYCE